MLPVLDGGIQQAFPTAAEPRTIAGVRYQQQ